MDKIQWFVWKCPPETRPHFFMFAHWNVMRERSINIFCVVVFNKIMGQRKAFHLFSCLYVVEDLMMVRHGNVFWKILGILLFKSAEGEHFYEGAFISIKQFNCQIFCTQSEHCFRRLYWQLSCSNVNFARRAFISTSFQPHWDLNVSVSEETLYVDVINRKNFT